MEKLPVGRASSALATFHGMGYNRVASPGQKYRIKETLNSGSIDMPRQKKGPRI